ncbi:MAG: FKBP-type peptidyl-prolyl cis-trans isomerase [Saprospiraceae bacterium]|nr:FKBP-type peptidyl-prolyl cis-trans isomerase [Saprospiraceae bacterium]MBL0261662.1 FKBP-type peptidyl-prolyl cis-trans isomerase [Saprospiraceae bacterium]
MDSFSYSLGILIGNNLKNEGITNISAPDLVEALEDVLMGKGKIAVQNANELVQKTMSEKAALQSAGVKEEGEKFLAENKNKPGIITTPSGLQYEVIQMGTGKKPSLQDKVKTHYHGTLINGKVFDSSVQRGEPISFPVNGVIKGWTEALQLMPVGSKFKLYIPYQLAYGERGAGADIKPFSALIFEVELLDIEQ